MNRLTRKGITIDQATRVWPVSRIVLDNLPLQHAEKNLIEFEILRPRLFICVVREPNTVTPYCIDDIFSLNVPSLKRCHQARPAKQILRHVGSHERSVGLDHGAKFYSLVNYWRIAVLRPMIISPGGQIKSGREGSGLAYCLLLTITA